MTETRTGSCLCGAISYRINGECGTLDVCHCSQCRRQSGHAWASIGVDHDQIEIDGRDEIQWYSASHEARRGFCRKCGSFLFWEPVGGDHIAVSAGSLDTPTGLTLRQHIFVADKGDYYEIADGLPQFPGDG
ncbi:MAG: GFA family protein [Hyphomicrobiales bacterium]|nr:GFA family protein [Hyphomicrobiales bacterium]